MCSIGRTQSALPHLALSPTTVKRVYDSTATSNDAFSAEAHNFGHNKLCKNLHEFSDSDEVCKWSSGVVRIVRQMLETSNWAGIEKDSKDSSTRLSG